ncbi:MAG: hypothetical protein IKP72_07710 [Clostridia bacterium]|nr:hypothetical protein [Clostridia bacterium]
MSEMQAAAMPRRMTQERLRQAADTLKKYKAGKARLEKRLIEDEKWWQGHAWDCMAEQGNSQAPKRPTKWLVNVIMGKHADMLDAYPEPAILPREESDEQQARQLSSILPVILEQNHFQDVYNQQAWEKNKHGTAVYAVYWDKTRLNGLGDVNICGVDLMNLFWEPGVEDIQKSRNLFLVTVQDRESLMLEYPQLNRNGMQNDFFLSRYETEDSASAGNTEKALVVDWYYHTWENGRKLLQYCKFCGQEALYASEDDPALEGRGWYDDGLYPFVLDTLFPQKGSPAGWGYIDLGKDTQEEIDLLNAAISLNARAGAVPRYFRRADSPINLSQFLDFTNPVIEVEGGLGEADMVPVKHYPLDKVYVQHLNDRIRELNQTCGNQEVSNGIASGVVAASGIAAQMEAAGRTSRDGNKGAYRAYARLLEMVIERIRQFYDIPRCFRITGEKAAWEFVQFDNSGLRTQENPSLAGREMGWRKPVFDIRVSAQKENAYTKMAQNELALGLLRAGVFSPEKADQSELLLSMMDFRKKDELLLKIQKSSAARRETALWQRMALELASRYEPDTAEEMARSILAFSGPPEEKDEKSGFSALLGAQETDGMIRARELARSVSQPE